MKTIEEWVEHWGMTCHTDLTDPDARMTEIDPAKMPAFVEKVRAEAMADGIHAGLCLAAYLHESVNPSCAHEREARAPGAGAIEAVVEYRDLIRHEADVRAIKETP